MLREEFESIMINRVKQRYDPKYYSISKLNAIYSDVKRLTANDLHKILNYSEEENNDIPPVNFFKRSIKSLGISNIKSIDQYENCNICDNLRLVPILEKKFGQIYEVQQKCSCVGGNPKIDKSWTKNISYRDWFFYQKIKQELINKGFTDEEARKIMKEWISLSVVDKVERMRILRKKRESSQKSLKDIV